MEWKTTIFWDVTPYSSVDNVVVGEDAALICRQCQSEEVAWHYIPEDWFL
jgi:hypothetical protein